MKRFLSIFLFALFLTNTCFAQKLKELQTRTWYCSCNFKTDSLIFAKNNSKSFEWEVSFSPSGKLTLKNLKKNTSNTVYSYSLNKNGLRIYYDLKDSLQNLLYAVSEDKAPEEGILKLDAFYAMRYKKQNKNDVPPSDNFTLVKGDKKNTFYSLSAVTVHSLKKVPNKDSVKYISKGEFLELRSDTMLLNVYQVSEQHFSRKSSDKDKHYKKTYYDSLIKVKIPLKEITRIYTPRERFNTVTTGLAIAAFGVFVVSFPIALAVKTDPVNDIFTRSAVFSALSIPVIISSNIIFSKRKFEVAPASKNKNTWQFEKLPGAIKN